MSVNSEQRTPQTLATMDACVDAILDMLDIGDAEATLRQRISTFIRCNGYKPVWHAALATMAIHRRQSIGNRWGYLVAVLNNTVVLLGQLYTYTHWVESGLRSQIDLAYCAKRGSSWYQFPDSYLPAGLVVRFVADASMPEIDWDKAQAGRPTRLAPLETSGHFLESVGFGWLIQMVLFRHKNDRLSILVQPDGTPLPLKRAESLLKTARDARNDVAHHHLITAQQFGRYDAALRALLVNLHFDVERTLEQVEKRREGVMKRLRESHAGQLGGGAGA